MQIFKDALKLGITYKKSPPDSYFNDLMEVLNNVNYKLTIQDELFADEGTDKSVKEPASKEAK